MNWGEILHKFLEILHIIGTGNSQDGLSTYTGINITSTPMIVPTSTLQMLTGSDIPVSHIFNSTFTTKTFDSGTKTSLVSGETGKSEDIMTTKKTTITDKSTSGEPSPKSTDSHTTESHATTNASSSSTVTGETTSEKTSDSPTSEKTTSGTSEPTSVSPASEKTTGSTSKTTSVSPASEETTHSSLTTGKKTSVSPASEETTPSGHTTSKTSSGSTVTGEIISSSTVTGETTKGTTATSESGSSVSDATRVAPTAEPKGLSRGTVAGIVIGCLLLVAVIAAAIVFFLKNRNTTPEHQRLRV